MPGKTTSTTHAMANLAAISVADPLFLWLLKNCSAKPFSMASYKIHLLVYFPEEKKNYGHFLHFLNGVCSIFHHYWIQNEADLSLVKSLFLYPLQPDLIILVPSSIFAFLCAFSALRKSMVCNLLREKLPATFHFPSKRAHSQRCTISLQPFPIL